MGSKKRYDTICKNSQKCGRCYGNTNTLFVKSLKTCSYRRVRKKFVESVKGRRGPPPHRFIRWWLAVRAHSALDYNGGGEQCCGTPRPATRKRSPWQPQGIAILYSRRCDVVTEIPTTYCTAVAVDLSFTISLNTFTSLCRLL